MLFPVLASVASFLKKPSFFKETLDEKDKEIHIQEPLVEKSQWEIIQTLDIIDQFECIRVSEVYVLLYMRPT